MAAIGEARDQRSASSIPAALDDRDALRRAREYFYALDPNIIGVNIGPRRVQNAGRPAECTLVVYVMEKRPLSELDPARVVPPVFLGLRTEVFAPLSADGARSSPADMRAINVHDFADLLLRLSEREPE
jgi:hypothetical protein